MYTGPDLLSGAEGWTDLEKILEAANDTGGSGGCLVLGPFPPVGVPAPSSEGWTGWKPTEGAQES